MHSNDTTYLNFEPHSGFGRHVDASKLNDARVRVNRVTCLRMQAYSFSCFRLSVYLAFSLSLFSLYSSACSYFCFITLLALPTFLSFFHVLFLVHQSLGTSCHLNYIVNVFVLFLIKRDWS